MCLDGAGGGRLGEIEVTLTALEPREGLRRALPVRKEWSTRTISVSFHGCGSRLWVAPRAGKGAMIRSAEEINAEAKRGLSLSWPLHSPSPWLIQRISERLKPQSLAQGALISYDRMSR